MISLEVTDKQICDILELKQSRLSLLDTDNNLDIHKGDAIVFIHENKTACVTVTDVDKLNIQDTTFEDMYNEGIRPNVPDILKNEPQKPNEYNKWTKEKQDEYVNQLARATYIAKCKLAKDMEDLYKMYWDSTTIRTNIHKFGYKANPMVKAIRFKII